VALVKVTALKNVIILDPFPMEGVGHVTIQLTPGQYQAYHMYDHQADRLQNNLASAFDAGMLTYDIEWSDTSSINNKRYASFSFVDVVPGSRVLLGVVPVGAAVEECTIKIEAGFDSNVTLSVGDDAVNARLMRSEFNNPDVPGTYKNDVDYKYTSETALYLYFVSGNPTKGLGEVFIYLS